MSIRKSIINRGRAVTTDTVLRHRRTRSGTPTSKGMEGKVVLLRNSEDVVLKMLRYSPVTVSEYRAGEYLHVSDLLGKCVRKVAISHKLGVGMPASNVSDSLALTFAQGTAIHDYVKGKFISGHKEKIFGKWSCFCGKTTTENMIHTAIPNIQCQHCGTAPHKYHELELYDNDLMVVGSPDITLYLSDLEAYFPIEIKSMAYDEWKVIARPKPVHVLQVLCYWYLLRKNGYSVTDKVSILYVSKGYIFKTPYKEFTFTAEDQLDRLEPYFEEALELLEYRSSGELPRRVTCTNQMCGDAKACHVAVPCFQFGR